MHRNRQKEILEVLKTLARDAKPPGHAWGSARITILGASSGSEFLLLDEASERYEQLCREVLKEKGWAERSRRVISTIGLPVS
jgi:hypothetical protein